MVLSLHVSFLHVISQLMEEKLKEEVKSLVK